MWAAGANLNEIDRLERKFLKSILNVKEQTANAAVYGEYGRIPLSFKIKEKVIKYFVKLQSKNTECPTKHAFETSRNLHDLGYTTWYTHAVRLNREFGLIHLIDTTAPPKLTDTLKSTIKNAIISHYKEQWENMDIAGHTKLETYRQFKNEFKPEAYLRLPQKNIVMH